jgi:vancomycin aglycone glucosyltransferase
LYDQHYFAQRVAQLGIGVAHAPGTASTESLTDALQRALQTDVAARAQSLAGAVREDGAQVAAEELIRTVGARS